MLKKFLMVCMVFFAVSGVVSAQETTAKTASQEWDFIQLSVWFGVPSSQNEIQTSGVRVGLPFSGGTAAVNGLELAVFAAASDKVNGVQAAPVSIAKDMAGVQMGIVTDSNNVCGTQIGIINFAKDKTFQIGFLNFVRNGPLPVCILFNYNF